MKSDNLSAFSEYLASKAATNKKYAPYYVRWVATKNILGVRSPLDK